MIVIEHLQKMFCHHSKRGRHKEIKENRLDQFKQSINTKNSSSGLNTRASKLSSGNTDTELIYDVKSNVLFEILPPEKGFDVGDESVSSRGQQQR